MRKTEIREEIYSNILMSLGELCQAKTQELCYPVVHQLLTYHLLVTVPLAFLCL